MRKMFAALAVFAVVSAPAGHAQPISPGPPQPCYQKLLYRVCVGDDGQWRVDPSPALPIPGMPPA